MLEPWEEHDYASISIHDSQHSIIDEIEMSFVEQNIDMYLMSPLQELTESIENLIDVEMLGEVGFSVKIPTELINDDVSRDDEFTMQTLDIASEKSNDGMIFENRTNLNAIFPGATPP